MPERIDFSGNAAVYDLRHGAVISQELARTLASRMRREATIVDIGAGTGRVTLGLTGCGLRVVAIEPALPMLQALRRKSSDALALTVAADGSRLPLRGNSADAVLLSRVLYLVPDWRSLLREAKEVLRQGGLLFHEWGNGEEGEAWVRTREKARSLFREAGVASLFHPGARSEQEVDSYLLQIGFLRKERIEAGAGPALTLTEFLDKIESGELSYVWNVPKDIQDFCLPKLRRWCESKFDLHESVPMPAEVYWIKYENAT